MVTPRTIRKLKRVLVPKKHLAGKLTWCSLCSKDLTLDQRDIRDGLYIS